MAVGTKAKKEARAETTPRLKVLLYRGKEVVKEVYLDDPRRAYCESYNRMETGLTAKPA